MTGKSKKSAQNVSTSLPRSNADVGQLVQPCMAILGVEVFALVDGNKVPMRATVKVGAVTSDTDPNSGVATFRNMDPGTVDIEVSTLSDPDSKDYYVAADHKARLTLSQGQTHTAQVQVKLRNVIQPKLKVEHKVVILDRDLAQYQLSAGEPASDHLRPDPTAVEIGIESSLDTPQYDGEATFEAPNCEVFLDAACTKKLSRKLSNTELTANPPTKLFLRGTTRGTFELKLSLDPHANPAFRVQDSVKRTMGVVELQLQVFQHSTPVAVAADTYPLTNHCADLEKANLIPDQVAMSDADKVETGRLLHLQHKGHHGRAKAVLKVTAAEWPVGTDDYILRIEQSPASLTAYDAETKGKKVKLPAESKVGDLKTADLTIWLEGSKISNAARDIRLSVALDRSAGGMKHDCKHNADWGRITVVEIASVKLHYVAPAAGNPIPWNAAKKQWYINYQAGDAGRELTIRAKLSKPIEKIELHFMLAPDENILKRADWGEDLPASWNWALITADVKHKDKTTSTDLLHKSEKTDAAGQADCKLHLSRFGGDIFRPASYINQDPHLAAYVHGHIKLEERKPNISKDRIEIWRKFAYQKIKVESRNYPVTAPAQTVYKEVKAVMHKLASVQLTRAQINAMALPCLLPEYMFEVGGGRNRLALNASDANQGQLFAAVAAEGEHPIKIPMITCDHNWGNERNSGVVTGLDAINPTQFPLPVPTDVHACDPPLQGGTLLATGDWTAAEWDAGSGTWINARNGALAAGDVDIDPSRTTINHVRVALPAGVGPVTVDTRVWISNLTVCGAPDHFLGGYNIDGNQRIVCVFDPSAPRDYINTIVHEVGHAFYQTGNVDAASNQRTVAPGVPLNPNYIKDLTGPHCTYNTDRCVMFTSGPIAASLNKYCPDCHPHLLLQDMSSIAP